MSELKHCTKCKEIKALTEFNKNARRKDGYRPECRACQAEVSKKYLSQPKIKAAMKVYQKAYYSQPHTRDERRTYRQTPEAKIRDAKARKRTHAKFLNAYRSRGYYGNNKHKLTPLDHCQHCNIIPDKIESHHSDYNKPLEVIYLCAPCHIEEHKENTPLNRETGIFTEAAK